MLVEREMSEAAEPVAVVRQGLAEEGEKVDDASIVRYLAAYDGNVDKAICSLKRTLAFREASFPSRLEAGTFKNEFLAGKAFWRGVDREGRPVLYIKARLHVSSERQMEESLDFTVWTLEVGLQLMSQQKKAQFVIVYDAGQVGRTNLDYQLVKEMMKLQSFYANLLYRVHIVNGSFLFNTLFRIIRSALEKKTADKLTSVRTMEELYQSIAPSQLVSDYSGEDNYEYCPDTYIASMSALFPQDLSWWNTPLPNQ